MKTIGIALTIFGTALFAGAPVGAAEWCAPHAKVDGEGASTAVASLKCGVLESAQPDLSGLWERKAKPPALGSVAFIDDDACRSYADDAAAANANEVAK